MDFTDIASAYWNPGAGWVEADKAIGSMMKEAVGKGIVYAEGEVEVLVLDREGEKVKGVRTRDGRLFTADQVLLATGAWTSSLLSKTEDELEIHEEDRVEQQCMAAGVCVVHYKITEEEMQRFDKSPVVVYGSTGAFLLYIFHYLRPRRSSVMNAIVGFWSMQFLNLTCYRSLSLLSDVDFDH